MGTGGQGASGYERSLGWSLGESLHPRFAENLTMEVLKISCHKLILVEACVILDVQSLAEVVQIERDTHS